MEGSRNRTISRSYKIFISTKSYVDASVGREAKFILQEGPDSDRGPPSGKDLPLALRAGVRRENAKTLSGKMTIYIMEAYRGLGKLKILHPSIQRFVKTRE
jgi:hypothetical protein